MARPGRLLFRLVALAVTLAVAFAGAAHAQQPQALPAPEVAAVREPGPVTPAVVDVQIGFYLTAIHEVDWRLRKCQIDVYWWIRYPASVPAHERALIEQLEMVNIDLVEGAQKDEQERKIVRTPAGEQVYVAYRTAGRVYLDADFRRYPFDEQTIPITVEHASLDVTRLRLVDDAAAYRLAGAAALAPGVAPDVRVADLEVLGAERRFFAQPYATDFGDPEAPPQGTAYARAQFLVHVGRPFVGYLVKILIPLSIIVLLAYLVFYVPAQSLEVAAGLTVTSLLACIAFQITVTESLPDVGYLMTSDRIFYVCYLFIMMAMAQTVLTFNLEAKGRQAAAVRLDMRARWLFPLAFVAMIAGVLAHGLLA